MGDDVADAPQPTLSFYFPLWLVVYRRLWLESGLPDAVAMVATGDLGDSAVVFLDDEHLAVQFLEDAGDPAFATIQVRDKPDLRRLIVSLQASGVRHVGINIYHPSRGKPGGWLVTIEHFLARLDADG